MNLNHILTLKEICIDTQKMVSLSDNAITRSQTKVRFGMRSFFALLSVLTCVLGLIMIVRGCDHPNKYQKELSKANTTAVRVTQIYAEATHIVVVGIGIICLGILTASIGRLIYTEEIKNYYSSIIKIFKKNPNDLDE